MNTRQNNLCSITRSRRKAKETRQEMRVKIFCSILSPKIN